MSLDSCHPLPLEFVLQAFGGEFAITITRNTAFPSRLHEIIAGNRSALVTLPQYVQEEFESFLRCSDPLHGFIRLRCDDCGVSRLLALSCKKRGFCPSCGSKRMIESEQNLQEYVLPSCELRQWVLTLPIALRFWVAHRRELLNAIVTIASRAILRHYRRLFPHLSRPLSGGVLFIQRFGGSANLHPHFHFLMLDGVYHETPSGNLNFLPAPTLSRDELGLLLNRLARQTILLLQKRGLLKPPRGEDEHEEWNVDPESFDAHQRLILSSVQRGATAPKQHRLGKGFGYLGDTPTYLRPLTATNHGFSLDASIDIAPHQGDKRARLIRYMARPALAGSRITRTDAGHVLYRLKTPWPNGVTHLEFSEEDFVRRLAALVPPPRGHLIRYFGVLAPASPHRSLIIPSPRLPFAGDGDPLVTNRQRRLMADLLKHTFGIDLFVCRHCGGGLKRIALVLNPRDAAAIIAHETRTQPPLPPTTGPPSQSH
jgi:hypothetical protein